MMVVVNHKPGSHHKTSEGNQESGVKRCSAVGVGQYSGSVVDHQCTAAGGREQRGQESEFLTAGWHHTHPSPRPRPTTACPSNV